MEEIKELLTELCHSSGPAGNEGETTALVNSYFSLYADKSYCHLSNSVVGELKPTVKESEVEPFKVMLCAHLDQIALSITKIDENGFCFFSTVGYDEKILASQSVTILGREKVFGLITVPTSANRSDTKSGYKLSELSIDTGLPASRVKKLIRVGDFAHINSRPLSLLNNNFSSAFLDDRVCVTALIMALKNLKSQARPSHLYFVASSSEEFSGLGATTVAYDIQPDFAIALDVTFATQPHCGSTTQKLGEGITISCGPLYDQRYLKQIVKIATDNKIKFKLEVDKSGFGTDAASIRSVGEGIPVCLISLPIENMHTPVELANLEDLKELIRFISLLGSGLQKESDYA